MKILLHKKNGKCNIFTKKYGAALSGPGDD
jgi:hypothetical protein